MLLPDPLAVSVLLPEPPTMMLLPLP